MKRVFIFIVSLLAMINGGFAKDYRAVLVADIDSGAVLYQENANQLNYPASLTKIMTLYLTFDALRHERLRLDDYLIVSKYATEAQPVKLGLVAGSKIKVEDAIKAVAVLSANDVARVLAENLKGGNEGSFANMMTNVATEIGLKNTNFENSSGLPNEDHLSTARDIALLSMAVYKHFPEYWKYFGIKTWTYNGKTYTNGNRLLGNYPGCDGMKTGFTNKSKYSLVATAKRNGTHLMAVVLGAEDKDVRANVATRMLNLGFSGGQNKPVVKQNTPITRYSQDAIEGLYHSEPVYGETEVHETTKYIKGDSGIQFGAFSSYTAAQNMTAKIKNLLNVVPIIERSEDDNLYRVRVNGITNDMARKLKHDASIQGIETYIYQ